jgi:toxin ParE1/3/4
VTRIEWSVDARKQLRDIRAHIDERDPAASRRIVDAIVTRISRLTDFPQSAPAVGTTGLRKLVVQGTPYLVLYRYRDGALNVLNVRHSAENWLRDL